MKKLVSILLICLIVFSLSGFKNTFISKYNETIYIFDDYEMERYFYENALNNWQTTLFHSSNCPFNDPEYFCANLKGEKFIAKKLYTEEKELENNVNLIDWAYGGEYGGTMSYSKQKSLTYNFEDYIFTIPLSGKYTFNIPPKRKGNIRYKMIIEITHYSYEMVLKNGEVKTGRYKEVKHLGKGYFYAYFE